MDEVLNGELDRCVVERNLAVFVSLDWEPTHQLRHLRCQALSVQNGDLCDYYCGEDCDEFYLRLDFDPSELGPIFTHPLPHIHAQPGGGARFPMDAPRSGNVFIDFVDFVYRNCCHDIWIVWARDVWNDEVRRRDIKPDPFEVILEAFKANQADDLLSKYARYLHMMKDAWRREKDEMFPLRVHADYRELLSYTT